MPVTVVVGGQFGSEGKGKVAYFWARSSNARVAVRVGGPNSGHSVVLDDGKRYVLRQVPTPMLIDGIVGILPAGSYLDLDVLTAEIRLLDLTPQRLAIDPLANVVTREHQESELAAGLASTIGSTLSGTGAAVQRRIGRDGSSVLARSVSALSPFLTDTVPLLRKHATAGHRIVVEGTQGIGLSVLHGSDYPFATARDTSAAGAVSEAGLSPLDVDEVVLVLRAFPIRVGGNSGPLPNETDWHGVQKEGKHDHSLAEFTSVTSRLRRVADFDPVVVRRAIAVNAPTTIVMNHLDYLDHRSCLSANPTEVTDDFVARAELSIGRTIDLLGLGPTVLLPRVASNQRVEALSG